MGFWFAWCGCGFKERWKKGFFNKSSVTKVSKHVGSSIVGELMGVV